jgi:hypothetical protein
VELLFGTAPLGVNRARNFSHRRSVANAGTPGMNILVCLRTAGGLINLVSKVPRAWWPSSLLSSVAQLAPMLRSWLCRAHLLGAFLTQAPSIISSSGGGGGGSAAPAIIEHAAESSLDGLHAALDRARVHRAAGRDVVVQLHGRYPLDSTLNLGEQLLSPEGSAVVSHGAVALRGPAVLDGGVRIDGWTKDATRPWLFAAEVPAELKGINVTQMWDGERRVALARTPLMHYNRSGPVNATTTLTNSIITNPGQVDPALDLTSARMFIYHTWDVSYHPIATIRNSQPAPGYPITQEIVATNQIEMRWNGGGLSGGSGYRYYLEGAEAFLKSGSGMFFHDVSGGRLLYAPVGGAQPGVTVAAKLAELVRSDGVDDVTMESLTVEHASQNRTTSPSPPCRRLLPLMQTQQLAIGASL